jgi:hypothetical protein
VPFSVRAQRSYFIVYPDHDGPSPRLLTFRDWLLERAQATVGPPPAGRAQARTGAPGARAAAAAQAGTGGRG